MIEANRSFLKQNLKKLTPFLKILFSILLLIFAFSKINWLSILDAIPLLNPYWLSLSLILIWVCNGLSGCRWGLLMRAGEFNQPLHQFIKLYFCGGLINQGLPTTIGGDAYRGIVAQKNSTQTLQKSFFIVAIDRSLGFAGNCLLGGIGLVIGGSLLGTWVPLFGKISLCFMLLGSTFLAISIYWPWSKDHIHRLLSKIGVRNIDFALKKSWGFPFYLIQLPLATAIHFLTLAAFWACLKSCGVNPPIEALLIGIPALGLLLILPLSISGWGVRETSLVSILGLWGLDSSLVVLSSILYGLITLIAYLPGLPFLIHDRKGSHLS